ncbi:hypothetical protein KCU78_g1578, partial [Aureobasidium melanogenum]
MERSRPEQERTTVRQPFQHDGTTATLTLARQTGIRMPMMDVETTFTALFVLDNDVPVDVGLCPGAFTTKKLSTDAILQMINGLLEQVNKESQIYNIWLAETAIPDGLTEEDGEATVPPIDGNWQSAFVGDTVEQAFEFLTKIPLEKSLNRTYIIVLDKNLYEQKNWVVLYRIDEEGEITSQSSLATGPTEVTTHTISSLSSSHIESEDMNSNLINPSSVVISFATVSSETAEQVPDVTTPPSVFATSSSGNATEPQGSSLASSSISSSREKIGTHSISLPSDGIATNLTTIAPGPSFTSDTLPTPAAESDIPNSPSTTTAPLGMVGFTPIKGVSSADITATFTTMPSGVSTELISLSGVSKNTWYTTTKDSHTTILPVIWRSSHDHGELVLVWGLASSFTNIKFAWPGMPEFSFSCIKVFGITIGDFFNFHFDLDSFKRVPDFIVWIRVMYLNHSQRLSNWLFGVDIFS